MGAGPLGLIPMIVRDETKQLLVIDGPFKGQRMARPGDSFTEVIGSSSSRMKGRFTYTLRQHRLLGLVWAFPTNKSVSIPS